MPRTGPNGEYTLPPNTNDQQPNTTIRSSMFNGFATDVQQALNTEWPAPLLPIVPVDKGGTGGETVEEAQENLQVLSASYALMSIQPNISVNGSLIVSQENGNALGTTNGYFYADQHALYKGSLGVSAQRVAYTSLSGGQYAGEFKCTTAKTTLGATDLVTDTEVIEGSRPEWVAAGFGTSGAKQFVYRKEVQKPAGLYHFHFSNSAGNRHCAVPYTITAGQANAKTVVEVVVPGDTSGTWLKTDGVIGLVIDDVLVAGSTYTGGSASTWDGPAYYAASTQANFLSSTANVARHADFGLKLDPDATGVYGAYEVGEVDYTYNPIRYVEKFDASDYRPNNAAFAQSAESFSGALFYNKKAKSPSITSSGTFSMEGPGANITGASISFSSPRLNQCDFDCTGGSSSGVTGEGGFMYPASGSSILVNARLS